MPGLTRDDLQGGLNKPQQTSPRPAPAAAPDVSPGPIKTSIEPTVRVENEKPVPALLQHGFTSGISTFNQRVQSVHDTYTKAYGVPPSPGLVFDLAKSPVDVNDFAKMFQVPLNSMAARNRGIATLHGINPDEPAAPTAKTIAAGITKAAFNGNYHDYITQHADVIHQLSYQNKNDAATIAGAVFKAKRYTIEHDLAEKVAAGELTDFEATNQLRAEGFLPTAAFKAPKGVVGGLATAIGQITDSLVHSPAGLYEVGRAAGLDTYDALRPQPAGTVPFARTRKIGKQLAHQTAQDFEHPSQNPGYLFLDALGLLSAGAGVAVRGSAALGAVGEAADEASLAGKAGAAAKAFAKKPELQRKVLDYGGYREEMPLSQNPLVAAVQKVTVGAREKAANARLAEDAPAGLRSILLPEAAQDWLDENLSFPTKMGREADARKRVDHIVQTTISRELDHVAGRSVMQARVQAALPSKLRGALTRGEQKAIQVLSWDDPDPITAERDFHHRMLELGIGDPKAHQRQLADLKLAEKALVKPSPRFQQALELTKRVIAEQQRIKVKDLGLLPETAEGRVAKAAQVLRGEAAVGTGTPERVLPVEYDEVSRYASPRLPISELSRLLPKGDYLYHSTDSHLISQIASEGLKPGKERPSEVTGVYFGQDAYDISSLRPGRRRAGDVLLRVHRNKVKTKVTDIYKPGSGFEEHVSPKAVPASALEYLGSDNKWHPLSEHGKTRASSESFYMPTQRRGKVKRPPSDRAGYFPTKAGPFGIPLGRDLPELTHEFTGKALMAGDYRIDATSLASEAYARTVRAATIRAEHAKLWAAAHDTPRTRWDIPIRDSNDIADKLREVVARLDEGDFTAADARELPQDAADLIRELYPDPRKLTKEQIEGVKWIDGRLLGDGSKAPKQPSEVAKAASLVNTPFRFTALYLRPAYILNKLGNHAMLWFDQGIHTVPNFIKAMSADTRYGEENARTIRELVGAGRSQSYVTKQSGKAANAVAEFWNRVADRDERVTAFIYYMERKGYKTRAQVDQLLHDPERRADLAEVKRRANKSLVEFDNLTEFEKNTLRHFIFVYPWVSRSLVYSLRAIMDHPARTDVLSKLGQQDYETDPLFKLAPKYWKEIGYIPIGFNHDGSVRVVNPTSINTFSTLGDFVALARAATEGDKYASAADFLGPFPTFLIHAVTGRDEYGNQYPGSQWLSAAKEVLTGLPQVSAAEKAGKYKKGQTRLPNIADRSSLETALNANLKKTVLSPGWLDGYGSLIGGGLSPRSASLPALVARYWRDQNPQVRHQRELGLLNRALDVQGEALARPVPKQVRAAVADQANIDFAYKKFLKATGRAPTDKERAGFTINYLAGKGMISKGQQARFRKELAPLADPTDINRLKNGLLDRYANGTSLRQWDQDIRAYASFTPEIVNQKAAELYAQGLSDQKRYAASPAKLSDYGRKYVEFTHQVRELQQQIKEGKKTADDLRAFQDANDRPVDGLPSFVRMAWANLTTAEQKQKIASNATAAWGSLSAFDKTLLGRPTPAAVTAGWAKLKDVEAEQRAALKREGRSFPSGYLRQLARYVERYYDTSTGEFTTNPKAPPTGLVKDFDFGKQPLLERMKLYTPIRNSPNRALWGQVLNQAKEMRRYLTATDDTGRHVYKSAQVRQMWSDYVNGQGFQTWLGEHPAFKRELDGYGRGLLVALIG